MIALDSSALLKRYLDEPGATFVAEVMEENPQWAASALSRVEAGITLCRYWSAGVVRASQLQSLDDDWERFLSVPVDGDCLARAQAIGCEHGVGTLDAIHLAAALAVPGDPAFLTFDLRQRDAAVKLGLPVIVPSGGSG